MRCCSPAPARSAARGPARRVSLALLAQAHGVDLKRRTQAADRAINERTHLRLARARRRTPVRADHPPARRAEERLCELALARERLVHPREHVARVPQRVVSMQLDRPREPARPATRERSGEGGGQRAGAGLREQRECVAGSAVSGCGGDSRRESYDSSSGRSCSRRMLSRSEGGTSACIESRPIARKAASASRAILS
jgi:hypothetical protein